MVLSIRLIYVPTLISLIHAVSFHLMKKYFCYPIFKTTCFVTIAYGNVKKWRQDDACTVRRNTQSLYHAASSIFFILQLKTAIYYLTSDLFIFFMRISCYLQFFFLNFAIRYLFFYLKFSTLSGSTSSLGGSKLLASISSSELAFLGSLSS